jgi:acetyl esterase/lipase
MALSYDPEVLRLLTENIAEIEVPTPCARGDWEGRRIQVDRTLPKLLGRLPPEKPVPTMDYSVEAEDGHKILLRLCGRGTGGALVLYLHGSGMIAGGVDAYDALVRRYASRAGVPFLAVDYRLAPEHQRTGPVEDAFAGLAWAATHAEEIGIDSTRIIVAGDSAGGGLAAGLALLARDRGGPRIARQVLIYPMLDDRTTEPDPQIAPFAGWTYDDNATGWSALLGDDMGTERVSPYAAPARATDLSGLPPAYIEVGQLDIFRDESIDYAMRLSRAGVEVEMHVHPGIGHGTELVTPTAAVSQRQFADRTRAFQAAN